LRQPFLTAESGIWSIADVIYWWQSFSY